jgi:hypothetical protein
MGMTHHTASRLYGALLALALSASPAFAQFRPRPDAQTPLSERYLVESQFGWWNPTPEMSITSESLGILGSRIDFGDDLGLSSTRFTEFRFTLHPARKHKFRFQYIPLRYEQETRLRRTLVFNGQRYEVGVPVISQLEWKAYRFTYEYDFISMSRGFGGFVLDLKQTDVQATLRSPLLNEFTKLKAPVPAFGGIARVYVVPSVSITGELSGITLPRNDQYNFNGHYADLDIYGTVNFHRHVGAHFGYRSFDVDAFIDNDSGAFTVKGFYFGVVARY